jgi:hypothetical protein
MRKAVFVCCALLSALLCLALVSSARASDRWSDSFSDFVPVPIEAGYSFDDWTEFKNSSNANVTYSFGSADGVLSVAEHVLGIPTVTQDLMFLRNITVDGETTNKMRFCMNNMYQFALYGLHTTTVGSYLWYTYIGNVDNFFFFKWKNVSTTEDVHSAALTVGSWYTFALTWHSAPNSYDYLLSEDNVDTPLLNGTVTNHLYDDTDLVYLGLDFGGASTVSLGRVQIDYLNNGAGSFGGSGNVITSWMPTIISFGMLAMVCGFMKKMGR